MIVTTLQTGLRFSKLAGLEWTDINWDTGMLCVQRSNVRGSVDTPKNNRLRHIPLASDVKQELHTLKRHGELVFSIEGCWIRYDMAWQQLAKICDAAKLPHLGWHDLRHTFASQLTATGAPLKAVQDLMGHSTIEMTMRYSHLNNEDLCKAIALLDKTSKTDT